MKAVADLVEIAGGLPPTTVVIAGGDRVEDLRLVESAQDHGIVDRIILVGRGDGIRQALDEVAIAVAEDDVIATKDDEHTSAVTAELVRDGVVDIVLKGNISTPIINRYMLPLAVRPTVSLASIFDAAPIADGRPMVLTDAGVTTVCNFGRLVGLVNNAVDVARVVMGIERPRVAILSANEKLIPSLRSTQLAAKLAAREWPHAVVYGPLSFDLATEPESVAIKGLPDKGHAFEVAGQADVLVCPSIDSANALYKTVTAMIKYGQASLAGITVGFPAPYIILSRADALETRLHSVALCSIYAHRSREADSPQISASIEVNTSRHRVLAINPGSTSMKVALFEGRTCVEDREVAHEISLTADRDARLAQVERLADMAEEVLAGRPVDAVSGRGGFLPYEGCGFEGGTFRVAECEDGEVHVDEAMVEGVLFHAARAHASNFGVPVAATLARRLGVPAFTVDPVMVDEFSPEARPSGLAGIERRSAAHVLSVRAAARRAAEAIGLPLEETHFVVAHLGGGITVGAVDRGRLVDGNISLLGGGPFTSQRAGLLPTGGLIDLCFSGKYTREEVIRLLTKQGGLRSYLGEDNLEKIEQRIEQGDEEARRIVDAMVYQVAKEIGAMAVAAGVDLDAIVLTGGMVRSERVRRLLRKRVGLLAPIMEYPGSLEMEALAAGARACLAGHAEAQHYSARHDGVEEG